MITSQWISLRVPLRNEMVLFETILVPVPLNAIKP